MPGPGVVPNERCCFSVYGTPLFKHHNSTNASQPVPCNNTLAVNLMARAWNLSTKIHTVTNIVAAKLVARKWAQNLPVH